MASRSYTGRKAIIHYLADHVDYLFLQRSNLLGRSVDRQQTLTQNVRIHEIWSQIWGPSRKKICGPKT